MEKKENMPLWVFLAFSSISTRKGALILIGCTELFTLYCFPWSLFFAEYEWVGQVFLIDDWSWLAMMVPILAWYCLCLIWVDKNKAWGS